MSNSFSKHPLAYMTLLSALNIGFSSCLCAEERAVPDHYPQRNDVTIRTLNFRNVGEGDEKNVFRAIDTFHANRLEWVYLNFNERELHEIQHVKDVGLIFGGASSSTLDNWVGDKSNIDWRKNLAMLDLNGNPVVPPHKRKWARLKYIGDPSNPEYLEGHIQNYLRYVEYGADTLQRDELRGFVSMVERHGGGFTETGVAGFSKWLKKNLSSEELAALGVDDVDSFRYDNYLRAKDAPVGDAFKDYNDPLKSYWIKYWSDVAYNFYTQIIHELKARAGRPITVSCNNSSLQVWDPEAQLFDFAISELLLGSANPKHIWERSMAAREVDRFQIFGSPKTRGTEVDPKAKVTLSRKVIATAYASGSGSRVPWDIFQQTEDGAGRYFGKPEDFASLYAFVRAQDWSGYDDITAFGPDVVRGRVANGVIEILDNYYVYAFVNRHESENKPVLIHLVDWGEPLIPLPPRDEMSFVKTSDGERLYFSENGEENLYRSAPEAFQFVLDKEVFSITDATEFTLLKPGDDSDLEAAVKRQPLSATFTETSIVLDLPALTPWSILEIK